MHHLCHKQPYMTENCAAEGASDMERRDLVLQGWDIDHKDIEIAKHDDGTEWLLGAGSYGKARLRPC